MKKPNKRLLYRSLYTALALIISGAVLYTFYTLPKPAALLAGVAAVMRPPVWGIVTAYILAQPAAFFERKVFRVTSETRAGAKARRGAALACTVISAAGISAVLLWICLPQLAESFAGFAEKLPNYIGKVTAYAEQSQAVAIYERLTGEKFEISKLLSGVFPSDNRGEQLTQFAAVAAAGITAALKGLSDFIIGFVIAVYLLSAKEKLLTQFRKLLFAVVHNDTAQSLLAACGHANKIFRSYLTGIIADCGIIGTVTFLFALILGAPFPLLIGTVIALTNFIPFFGPLFGGIPTVTIIALESPVKGLIFLVFLLILQQIDGNFLVPFIQRGATGLPSVWVIISIIIGGGVFGIFGMFLAVPTFAVLFHLLKLKVDGRLTLKHLPADTSKYARSEDFTRYTDDFVYTEDS